MTILQYLFAALAQQPLSGSNPPGNRILQLGSGGNYRGYSDGTSNIPSISGAYGALDNKVVGAFTINSLVVDQSDVIYLDFTTNPADFTGFTIYLPDFRLATIGMVFRTSTPPNFCSSSVVGITAWANSRAGLQVTCSVTSP